MQKKLVFILITLFVFSFAGIGVAEEEEKVLYENELVESFELLNFSGDSNKSVLERLPDHVINQLPKKSIEMMSKIENNSTIHILNESTGEELDFDGHTITELVRVTENQNGEITNHYVTSSITSREKGYGDYDGNYS